MTKLSVLLLILAGFAVSGLAQTPAPSGTALKVSDVEEMIKGGLSDDLVISAIRKDNHAFELSGADMVRLKKEGVSDNVMKVMLDPKATVTAPAAASVTPTAAVAGILTIAKPSGATPDAGASENAANANNPDAPHDSGIYLFTGGANGQSVMVPLERAATAGTKTGVLGAALTYGIVKGKTKAVIPRAHAAIRANQSKPVFYFFFEDKSAALGKSQSFGGQTVSNPNQFNLVKFEEKKDSREVVIGTIGFASASTGGEAKEGVAFRSERIRPGVYRVTPEADMKPGEYAFISASAQGAAGSNDIFDFAVNDSR